ASATPEFGPGTNTLNPVPTGTSLFEYDWVSNTINQVTNLPAGLNTSLTGRQGFVTRMLVLPSGQVMLNYGNGQAYLYTPDATVNPAWRPTITGIVAVPNPGGPDTFQLTGTQLNGISEGAAYGDDAQMATNYPIVELKGASGNVVYATTSNWSS